MSRIWGQAFRIILVASIVSLLSGCALLSGNNATGGGGSSPSPSPNPTPPPTPPPPPPPTPVPPPPTGDLTKINHIIFMLQENR
ncbi:MAG TPA: hypothetical protein VI636_05540, partial [Candidatus Angelobacter sp.]